MFTNYRTAYPALADGTRQRDTRFAASIGPGGELEAGVEGLHRAAGNPMRCSTGPGTRFQGEPVQVSAPVGCWEALGWLGGSAPMGSSPRDPGVRRADTAVRRRPGNHHHRFSTFTELRFRHPVKGDVSQSLVGSGAGGGPEGSPAGCARALLASCLSATVQDGQCRWLESGSHRLTEYSG